MAYTGRRVLTISKRRAFITTSLETLYARIEDQWSKYGCLERHFLPSYWTMDTSLPVLRHNDNVCEIRRMMLQVSLLREKPRRRDKGAICEAEIWRDVNSHQLACTSPLHLRIPGYLWGSISTTTSTRQISSLGHFSCRAGGCVVNMRKMINIIEGTWYSTFVSTSMMVLSYILNLVPWYLMTMRNPSYTTYCLNKNSRLTQSPKRSNLG